MPKLKNCGRKLYAFDTFENRLNHVNLLQLQVTTRKCRLARLIPLGWNQRAKHTSRDTFGEI
jgi:hypothetical protein